MGLIRLGWFEAQFVLPLTAAQAWLAFALFGSSSSRINVTLACSGADAVVLCAGAILAYPSRLGLRLTGVVMGTLMILALNILRIGTLGLASSSLFWFEALHVYIWPGVLALAIAGYVYAWMLVANRSPSSTDETPWNRPAKDASLANTGARFLILAAVFAVIFVATSKAYLESETVLAVASFIAQTAAALLGFVGLPAASAANVLSTARGSFLVTQECIVTPVIPLYLAGVLTYVSEGRRRLLAVAVAIPLFIVLGIARLLVVALPEALVASPLEAIHSFYQWLSWFVVVLIAARWRHGSALRAWPTTLLGGAIGVSVALTLGPSYAALLVTGPIGQVGNDPQGALVLLPSFQVGLYLALAVAAFGSLRWQRLVIGLGLLATSQIALFLLLTETHVTPHVRDVRGWALLAPLLVCVLMERWPSFRIRPRQTEDRLPSGAHP
ncbi:MAG: hypothetical protein ABI672_08000 [Vicinamibacteria bacterium]